MHRQSATIDSPVLFSSAQPSAPLPFGRIIPTFCAGAQQLCHFLDDLMAITKQIVKFFPFQRDTQHSIA
jgi:hypothetical protein